MPSLRTRNMEKRRQRILREARRLIAAGGYEALNLRALARAAGVTVPTIYNLVGPKEELVAALFRDALSEIEARVGADDDRAPLELAESAVLESTGLFEEDEDYFRAAFIALEVLDQSAAHHDTAASLFSWGEQLVVQGCHACRRAGLLRGRIAADTLAASILRAYRTSCRAWAFGRLDIATFRAAALLDLYLILAADAATPFRKVLDERIEDLSTRCASHAPRSQSHGSSQTG